MIPHAKLLRRDSIRIGGLTAFSLGLEDWLRSRRVFAGESEPKAKSCILIWLDGGPSHMETFDPKPDAPGEVRGPLGTIATSIPGVRFSECLPQTARLMDRLAVIRSMTSPLGEHNFGTHYMMSGYKPNPVLEHPTFGSVLAHQARRDTNVLPPNIAVPRFAVGGSKITGNGFLPSSTAPFSVGSDPGKPGFKVRDLNFYGDLDLARLDRRRSVVEALDRFSEDSQRLIGGANSDLEQAYALVSSSEAKRAFDLGEEESATRARYGHKSIGQSCLLARRLVERGVPFVTVNNGGWDTHEDLTTRLKDGYAGSPKPIGLVPSLDVALSALISDLDDRGLLEETLVVVMGEFGRTPKLNNRAGRDHWPRVFSVALAGGGVPGGQIIGNSDAVGESPQDRPVTPSDLAASIYRLLGVNPELELRTPDGRPVRVTPQEARALPELVG
ncbi:MAG: DUF1501 domain-containing protein [Planctomycetota bacterium]